MCTWTYHDVHFYKSGNNRDRKWSKIKHKVLVPFKPKQPLRFNEAFFRQTTPECNHRCAVFVDFSQAWVGIYNVLTECWHHQPRLPPCLCWITKAAICRGPLLVFIVICFRNCAGININAWYKNRACLVVVLVETTFVLYVTWTIRKKVSLWLFL